MIDFLDLATFLRRNVVVGTEEKSVDIKPNIFDVKKVSESKVAKSAITSGYSDLEVEWKRKASISNLHIKKVAISKVDKIM